MRSDAAHRRLPESLEAALRAFFDPVDRGAHKPVTGIQPSWWVATTTYSALVEQGLITPAAQVTCGLYREQRVSRVQITAAGCEAIGHDLAEIAAYARDQADREQRLRDTWAASPDEPRNPSSPSIVDPEIQRFLHGDWQ